MARDRVRVRVNPKHNLSRDWYVSHAKTNGLINPNKFVLFNLKSWKLYTRL